MHSSYLYWKYFSIFAFNIDVMGLFYLFVYVIVTGIATFLQKFVLKLADPYQINFIITISILIIALPALWWKEQNITVPIKSIPLGIMTGVMIGMASLVFILSLRKIHVGTASAISTSYVLIVVLLSWIFLKEPISLLKIAGILLTIMGVAILSYTA